MNTAREIKRAEKLFRSFFDGLPPAPDEIVKVRGTQQICFPVGALVKIEYAPWHPVDGKTNIVLVHEFKRSDRPLLLVNSDGRQAYILKGGYRFNARGFVG